MNMFEDKKSLLKKRRRLLLEKVDEAEGGESDDSDGKE